MTNEEKARVLELRDFGKGAKAISKETGLSENTIKTFIRRYSLDKKPVVNAISRCKECGAELNRQKGRRLKLFCTDSCRMRWWNAHQDQVNKKAIYQYECAYCKKPFTAYGNSHRKYCSHSCYVSDRYGG